MNKYYNIYTPVYPKPERLKVECKVTKRVKGDWMYRVELTNPPAGYGNSPVFGYYHPTAEVAERVARRQAEMLLEKAVAYRDGPRTFVVEEAA